MSTKFGFTFDSKAVNSAENADIYKAPEDELGAHEDKTAY